MARITVRRQPCWHRASLAPSPGSSRMESPGSCRALTAVRMSSSSSARMMHPPFQMRASSAASTFHPLAREASSMRAKPCAYEHSLDEYRAASRSSTRHGPACRTGQPISLAPSMPMGGMMAVTVRHTRRTTPSIGLRSGSVARAGRNGMRDAARCRCACWALMYRASSAAAIVAAGTACSAASCTVHLPVPFEPHTSRICSISSPRVPAGGCASSGVRRIFPVISMR
mmetsp:Transcript_23272/g.59821  ORF Transcript_23272/g.59821 Transcript_23272/m.59821 type:complete len:228 (-) Transcript_23272:872-1555(-)